MVGSEVRRYENRPYLSQVFTSAMVLRQMTVYSLILHGLLLLTAVDQVVSCEVTFDYNHDGYLFHESLCPDANGIDFGSYRFGCLGNLTDCTTGLTVHFWLKPRYISPQGDELILLTNGGHLPFSNGFFITRQWNDQFTFGMSKGDRTWFVQLRLLIDAWAHIMFTWEELEGLISYVDGFVAGVDVAGSPRTYVDVSYDVNSHVLLGGWSGEGVNIGMTYAVSNVTIVDGALSAYDLGDGLRLYIGCDEALILDNDNSITVNSGPSSASDCRDECRTREYNIARLDGNGRCNCTDISAINSANKNVTCTGQVKVFYVTHVTREEDFKLNISIAGTTGNSDINVLESTLITITTVPINPDKIELDFRDGDTLATNQHVVSHWWSVPGTYDVTVTVFFGSITKIITTAVQVIDLVEKIPPEFVAVYPNPEQEPGKISVEMLVVDSERTDCLVNFGDGPPVQAAFPEYIWSVTLQHTYSYPFGKQDILMKCTNSAGSRQNSSSLVTRNLALKSEIFKLGDTLDIYLRGDQPFLDSLAVTINDKNVPFSTTSNRVSISGDQFPDSTGFYISVSTITGVVLVSHILFAEAELSEPTFTTDSLSVIPNKPQNYTVSLPPGDHIHACVTFGSNGFACWYFDKLTFAFPISLSATYSSTGSYPNYVETSNAVSYKRDEIKAAIDVPITSINVTANQSISLDNGILFVVDLNMEGMPPRSVNFEIDYGDGDIEFVEYTSLNKLDFDTFYHRHIYGDWGIYSIQVTASNSLGSVTGGTVVQLGQNISYVEIRTNTERVGLNESVIIDFDVPKGSDITYDINLGDGTTLQIPTLAFKLSVNETIESYELTTSLGPKPLIRHPNPEDQVMYQSADGETSLKMASLYILRVTHLYLTAGDYSVSIKVTNVFNKASNVLCPQIIVRDLVTQITPTCNKPIVTFLDLTSLTISSLRSEDTVIKVDPGLDCLTNTSATFTWRATKYAKINGVSTKRQFDHICYFLSADDTLVIPARSLKYGSYELTLTVAPEDLELTYSSETLLLRIRISPPVASLGLLPTKITYIYGDTVLDMTQSKDPDLSKNHYAGLEFDLFCCLVSQKSKIEDKSLGQLRNDANMVETGTLFRNSSRNRATLYDSCGCFASNIVLNFGEGDIRLPSNQFTPNTMEFYFRLFVCKKGRCSSASQEIHVRSSNDSTEYDRLGDLLTSGDTDGALQLIGLLTSDLNTLQGGEGEDEDKAKEATDKRSFLITALSTVSANLTNIDQVENTANALEGVTRTKSQVTQGSRKSASSTINNVARGLGGSGKSQSLDKISTVGQGIVGSLSNLFPDAENERSIYTEVLTNKRRKRSLDDSDPEPTEEEIKCDIIKGIIGDENPAGCNEAYMGLIDFFYPKKMDKFRKVMENDPDDILEIILPELEEQKQKDKEIRLNADRDVAEAGMAAIDNVATLFLGKIDDNGTASLSSAKVSVSVQKLPANSSENDTLISGPGPYGMKMSPTVPNAKGKKMVNSAVNPFTYGVGSGDISGGITSLSLTDESGGDLVVRDTDVPFEIWLPADPYAIPETSYHTITYSGGNAGINYHNTQMSQHDLSLYIQLQITDVFDKFSVYIKYTDFPNETHYDYHDVIPRDSANVTSNRTCEREDLLLYTVNPPRSLTSRTGTYLVGIKLTSARIAVGTNPTNHTYGIRIFSRGCRFWNVSSLAWETSGCEVGKCTNYMSTQCLCNHLTSFGGNFVVPPNTIDFNTVFSKFAKLHENAAVFATVISILALYILLLIWGRYMDKKDVHKWGAIPLEDNLPSDTYHYQLSVHTGVKKGAGTDSRISFILSGDDNDTGVRCIFDGKRKHLGRGTIMNYVMSVESALGPLTFLRIWHDNMGKGKQKGWYLDQIEVVDLQSGERDIFLCDRWLAVEEDDGQVERILPVAGINDLVAFKHLFSSNVRKKLSNEHLWFSVFSRPTRSKFTRCQRISCCLSLLFLTMITNAMWFKTEGNNGNVTSLKVGPFSFTLQQVFISFASTMIVFPVSFLLITIFRKSRPKKNTIVQKNQQIPKKSQKYRWKSINNPASSNSWGDVDKSKKDKFKESMRNIISFHNRKYENEAVAAAMEEEALQKYGKKRKKKPMTFPHWTIYIGWFLVFLSVTTSAFFTILYSMEWGAEKANDWLITFVMSFFQSVVVVQPVKVLLMVAFVACILKKPEINEEEGFEDDSGINQDEELLSKSPESITAIMLQRKMASQELQPPDYEALEAAREVRLKEMKMELIIKEITIYALFVLVLFFISYQTRDSQSYQYASHLRNTFKTASSNGSSFEKINTASEFWTWAEKVIVPQLYPMEWMNGTGLKWWDKRCIVDMESRRVGIGRLRQLRMKNNSCKVAGPMSSMMSDCWGGYDWTGDDTKTYYPSWIPIEKNDSFAETKTALKKTPWDYQNSLELKNAPYYGNLAAYKGGGYVANFERTKARTLKLLQELKDNNWLDIQTRAVFLEFTIYNPNVNLFASITMLTEFGQTGGATRRSEFKVFRLFSYVGAFGVIVLLFEVIYACFTLYFLIHAIKKLKKEKKAYFKCFWNNLEFTLLAFSVTCIVMYAFKHVLAALAVNELHEAGSADFVNFNSLALYDELFGYMVGCVVFTATIQFMKMLQFNRRMNLLGDTIRLATQDLKNFSVMFFIYFFAFCQMGYLLFGRSLGTYGNFGSSVESMFAFCLGSFDFDQMQDSQRILGPIFFFMFVGIVYIGLMGIFVTIIYDSFATVKADATLQTNEHEIVDFMWKRLKGLIKG